MLAKGIEAVREFRSVMKADRATKEVIPNEETKEPRARIQDKSCIRCAQRGYGAVGRVQVIWQHPTQIGTRGKLGIRDPQMAVAQHRWASALELSLIDP